MRVVRYWSPACRPLPSIPLGEPVPDRLAWVRAAAQAEVMTASPAPYRGHIFRGNVEGQVKLNGF